MRTIDIASPGKITFAGFDMTWADAALEMVTTYVRRIAHDRLPEVEKCYSGVIALGPRHPGADANAKSAAESARKVVELFDSMKVPHDKQWRRARQSAEIVYQATAFRIEGQSPQFRDEMMARNVQWLRAEHPGEKIVIWAHNGHISADSDPFQKPMGAWLRESLGNRYYAIGFTLAGGKVRAVGSKGLAVYAMPAARGDAGETVLARASLPAYFLDLRALGAAGAWFTQPHTFYSVGAVWDEKTPGANLSSFPLAKSFDGLGFVPEGHASSAP
jgi:erythromycin esterase-like protein